jgi:hypothetical protein
MQRATWDGLAVSREKPYGASVVVWRYIDGEREFLLLHRRAPGGPDFAGDWAWTPPGEARLPGESTRPDGAAGAARGDGAWGGFVEPPDLGEEDWAV